ncbi:MAG: nucleoside kinase [Lachnospirales bacterium]
MVNVTYKEKDYVLEDGTTFLEFSKSLDYGFTPIIAKTNSVLVDLSREINDESRIDFLDLEDNNGYLAFQRSVSFMAYVAVKEVLGEKARMIINHSIYKSFYCSIEDIKLTEEDVKKIRGKMLDMVANNEPIERHHIRVDVATKLMKKFNNPVRRELIGYEVENSIVLYSLRGVYNFFYDVLACECANLLNFGIEYYNDGFVIIFPNRKNPYEKRELTIFSKVSQVFEESANWADILKVSNLASINKYIADDKIEDVIKINEALHDKKIAFLADEITKNKKKLVLIAGPSSSGKTTFSKRLCVHLEVNGIKPIVIGLDDYYKNRIDIPFGPDGKRNFEVIETLEIEMINRDLGKLLKGEEVELPHFNFVEGVKEWKGNKVKLKENSVIVIEGIHGLNDRLTEAIDKALKYKIFIAALTQISVDDINRISTRDTRLIRRIVRDHKFRGFHALTTIAMWEDVLQGEAENIFPYQEEADAVFNSAFVYELALLKSYVLPILYKVSNEEKEYSECRRLIKFLNNFLTLPADLVPTGSILREFIGGSIYE